MSIICLLIYIGCQFSLKRYDRVRHTKMLKVGVDLQVFMYLCVYQFYVVRACCFANQKEKVSNKFYM